MSFAKIGWCLGLTTEYRTELSDILYETAIVHKDHQPEDDQMVTGLTIGMMMGNLAQGAALGVALSHDEEYNITFKGENVTIKLDDEKIYSQFNEGDQVKLGYKEVQTITFDYRPPDFQTKQPLERVVEKYQFVSVSKL